MNRMTSRQVWAVAALAVCLAGGCASHDSSDPTVAETPTENGGPLAAIFGPTLEKSGAQVWAENCTRCHYVRPPNYYSAAQWGVVVRHMRSRANLTGEEERKVTAFLQAGSGAEE
jgi:cytochrome c5